MLKPHQSMLPLTSYSMLRSQAILELKVKACLMTWSKRLPELKLHKTILIKTITAFQTGKNLMPIMTVSLTTWSNWEPRLLMKTLREQWIVTCWPKLNQDQHSSILETWWKSSTKSRTISQAWKTCSPVTSTLWKMAWWEAFNQLRMMFRDKMQLRLKLTCMLLLMPNWVLRRNGSGTTLETKSQRRLVMQSMQAKINSMKSRTTLLVLPKVLLVMSLIMPWVLLQVANNDNLVNERYNCCEIVYKCFIMMCNMLI